MRRTGIYAALLVCVGLLVAQAATIEVAGSDEEYGKPKVVLRDDCDPRDPGWTPTGGCTLSEGDVTLAEFNSCPRSRHP
jgi:hypothetical protein